MYTIFKVLTIVFGCGFIFLTIKAIRKDKNKWIDIIISFFMSAFFFFLVYPIDQIEKKREPEISSQIITTIGSTAESSTLSTTTTTTLISSTTTTKADIITNPNEITKRFSHIDDYYTVTFYAPTSGKYRFDFLTDDTQTNYGVFLCDRKNETILESEYDTDKHGETVELTKGEKYSLTISQKDGFPTVTIKIHVPSEDAVLEFNN